MNPSDTEQESRWKSPSLSSTSHSPPQGNELAQFPSSFDLQTVYRLIVQQLAETLPIVTSLLVYYNLCTGDRLSLGHPSTVQDWQIEDFWHPDQKVGQLTPIPASGGVWGYVYWLNALEPCLEYLLLLCEQPLTPHQETLIQQQGKLLGYYLTLYQAEYRQQAKINLLEQVIQRLEHQLRNPLGLIALSAETLRLGLQQQGSLSQQAMVIRDTVNDLTAHLTDLLYCGQQANLQIAPYNLQTILLESLQGLSPLLEEKSIEIEYPDRPAIIPVDQWQMKQVFDNLLSNAIHFSPVEETIVCHWQVFQHEVLVEIRDRGCGLSPDDLKHVFTPFYSRRSGGQGLGLAIAQKIILDHQGRLWASNLAEGGAQFSFVLPLQPS